MEIPPHAPAAAVPSGITGSSGSVNVLSSAQELQKELDNFKKGVKRDESAFKIFKEDQYYLNFRRNLLVTARAQNVERVFDVDFDPTPLDPLDRSLYEQQMKFAYSVLTKVVQTSQGRIIVRQHELDGNATEVLRKLILFYTESRVAEKAGSDLLDKIIGLRFNASWSSGAKSFLNHWQNLVLDLEEIRGAGVSSITVTEKRPWLITSLATNEVMQNAITQWDSSARVLKLGLLGSGHAAQACVSDDVQYAGFP